MTDLATANPVSFVQVADRARSVAFYRDTLGLALIGSDDFGDAFAFGGGVLRVTAIPDWRPGEHPVIGWEVADIGAIVAALSAKGITMTLYEGMGQDAEGVWHAPDGRASLAWFNDPDGNCLCLSQHRKA